MKQKIFDTSLGEADKQHPKLDARLATLVVLGKKAYGTGVPSLETTQSGLRRDGPLAFFRGSASTLESTNEADAVQVFLTVRETAAFDRLTAKLPCLKLRSRAKTIATAEVRLSDLPSLSASGDVVAVEWTGAVRPASAFAGNMDSSYSARSVMGLEWDPADFDGHGRLVGRGVGAGRCFGEGRSGVGRRGWAARCGGHLYRTSGDRAGRVGGVRGGACGCGGARRRRPVVGGGAGRLGVGSDLHGG